jgi:hypothetical protein
MSVDAEIREVVQQIRKEVAELHDHLPRKVVNVVPGAPGAIWIRCFDTHEIAEVSATGDVYTDFYTEMYGVAVWKPVEAMGFVKKPTKGWPLPRYEDYQGHLENKAVLGTMQRAFDGLATLL